jgi:hypothetical protein
LEPFAVRSDDAIKSGNLIPEAARCGDLALPGSLKIPMKINLNPGDLPNDALTICLTDVASRRCIARKAIYRERPCQK